MESVLIIVVLVFAVVGMGFFIGRSSKEHDLEMQKIVQEQEAKDEAAKTVDSIAATPIDSIRDRLRSDASD